MQLQKISLTPLNRMEAPNRTTRRTTRGNTRRSDFEPRNREEPIPLVERECREYLERTDASEPGLSIRVADAFIHAFGDHADVSAYPDLQAALESYEDSPARVAQHEDFLQRVFEGCEQQIMNDPRVEYAEWRPHFHGRNGTMSQLVQNGYYRYYLYLVNRRLQANLLADAYSLLVQLRYSLDPRLLSEEQLEAVKEILRRGVARGLTLPSRQWWDAEIAYLRNKRRIVEAKEKWATFPPATRWWQFKQWSLSDQELPRNQVRQGIPAPGDIGLPPEATYSAYEYVPFPISEEGSYQQNFQNELERLTFLREFLTAFPERGREAAPTAERARERNVVRGGSRRRRRSTRRRRTPKN